MIQRLVRGLGFLCFVAFAGCVVYGLFVDDGDAFSSAVVAGLFCAVTGMVLLFMTNDDGPRLSPSERKMRGKVKCYGCGAKRGVDDACPKCGRPP